MRKLDFEWSYRELRFRFDAGTSRGVLKSKPSYFVKLFYSDEPEVVGLGEAGLIPGLSPDFSAEYGSKFPLICKSFCQGKPVEGYPAAKMALETALQDLNLGGKRVVFDNDFVKGKPIAINGLIWMGTFEQMREQIDLKVSQGFTCLKLKVGAIDFEVELELLRYIRTRFDPNLTIRVDANGAFSAAEAMDKLTRLAEFDLHSIEQPIAAGQHKEMARLCQTSPLPIALDEELFALPHLDKSLLLRTIRPAYVVLKPTLLGGIQQTWQWIEAAQKEGIGYWLTSALESNIGLNAIAQMAAQTQSPLPQGLGTGALFENNFDSPLIVEKGFISYQSLHDWKVDLQWKGC